MKQVLLMAHGWGYNHRFFNRFVEALPARLLDESVIACLEAGYFPEQAKPGLMIYSKGEWVHQPTVALQGLVLAHAGLPWLGLGHSQGLSKLLELSLRWHSLFSLHGFTRFPSNRVLARMVQKAEQNLPLVLQEFHARCGLEPHWTSLEKQALLDDLNRLTQLDCSAELEQAMQAGSRIYAWASEKDQIVPRALALDCFGKALSSQGCSLLEVDAEHADFAGKPALYTSSLVPLLRLN